MKKVSIVANNQANSLVKQASDIFTINRYLINAPQFEPPFDKQAGQLNPFTKHRLTRRFLDGIPESYMLYVITEDGHVDVAMAAAIGYADALGIPVYATEWPEEDAMFALVDAVFPLVDLDLLLNPE